MPSSPPLKCAVVGGGGFIGTHLCNALVRSGAHVRAFGRAPLNKGSMSPKVDWTTGELAEMEAWLGQLQDVDVLYPLVSSSTPQTAEADPATDVSNNVVGMLRLVDAAVKRDVKRIIFVSSGGTVYGIPTVIPTTEDSATVPISAYGLQKLTLERYLRLYHDRHGVELIIFRVANPYGPLQMGRRQQGVIATFINSALADQPLRVWGTDETVRDFIYIDDVVDALVRGATYSGRYDIFNVGSGQGLSLRQIITDIESVLGRGPVRRINLAAPPAAVPISLLDSTRLQTEMGWSPMVPWLVGLRRTVEWMSTQNDVLKKERA